jgi:hypothetical protein
MWYLQKEVVLTNDNLAKKNWNGGKQCCFCHANETVKHLFFDCYYAKFMWGLSYLPFNIIPPRSVQHLYGSWLNQFQGKLKRQALAGALAFCWAIWLSKNDVVFDKSPYQNFYACTIPRYALASVLGSNGQHDQDKDTIKVVCQKMESIAMQIFIDHGWRFNNRLCG